MNRLAKQRVVKIAAAPSKAVLELHKIGNANLVVHVLLEVAIVLLEGAFVGI